MTRVLVIEDEGQTRSIFMRCLAFEGFCAIEAENGTVGVKLAKMHLPDLIICDIMMPDMDGYGVLSAMRSHQATAAIPFIFLTAKVTMPDLRQGMEMGADDYLTKPCSVEQFLSAITTRLERQAQIQTRSNPPSSSPKIETGIFPSCPRLSQVFAFIEENYQNSISLSDVANAVGYSPAYLTNLVQELTGYSIKRWITERRMSEARQLLRETNQPVRQIAEGLGYPDAAYFTRYFRELHGDPPQSWRNCARLRSA
ncbi:response regulator [Pseudanabaena sp. ABRG5-3]|uniref:response regulator transcription factor n=1 Tax=Pseudanabaena sp. ABRG5-3 TaxID=685565 RepID=UPI000DC6EC74|nr:response regulator [Pseudanabaena sp. ABRG5-3]BBC27157.1 response regulator receiver domain protein [Pseudanabaena sp. ABRG5-3]